LIRHRGERGARDTEAATLPARCRLQRPPPASVGSSGVTSYRIDHHDGREVQEGDDRRNSAGLRQAGCVGPFSVGHGRHARVDLSRSSGRRVGDHIFIKSSWIASINNAAVSGRELSANVVLEVFSHLDRSELRLAPFSGTRRGRPVDSVQPDVQASNAARRRSVRGSAQRWVFRLSGGDTITFVPTGGPKHGDVVYATCHAGAASGSVDPVVLAITYPLLG